MTLADALESEKATLTAQEAADILGCSRQILYLTARDCPERLGFQVFFVGNRLKIPRVPLLAYLGFNK